ncbi:MAG: hypothetical protein COZ91_00950 [Candidatus Nealsonbacteria bacterium CG_4_8_14_3_um_filter_39_7]|nr:MAG: hypothetical protein COZ91_00950 [Candidatus Nealsonbacteria bacterium CG_4_8_14_3_um_filter_39_7]
MTASKIFLYLCFAFIIGIFAGSFFNIPWLFLPIFLILGLAVISIFWKYKKITVFGFCVLFSALGFWREQFFESGIKDNELAMLNDSQEKIVVIGTVVKEPDIRETNIKLTIRNEKTKSLILATVSRYPEYHYGDELKLIGLLEAPFEPAGLSSGGNYKDYLAKDGIYSVMYFPKVELLKEKNYTDIFSIIFGKVLEFKKSLGEVMRQNIPPPQSSLLAAIILGDQSVMSGELKDKLNITGVRHITSVSGMNIVILSGVLMWLGIALGLWRGQAFYFAIIMIILYIFLVGAPASAVRAGIMGGLFLLAQKVGRLSVAGRMLAMAAAFMLTENPLLLKSDTGFQLSFMATFGMIYCMPIIQQWFDKIRNPELSLFKEIAVSIKSLLAMTMAAQVFTLPILIYSFGYFSQVSPITNILIVPLLSYIMILGIVFALIGIIWPWLGWVLSLPVWALLTFAVGVIDYFSQAGWASRTLEISWIWLAISYLILGYITWRLNKFYSVPKFLR